MSYALKPCPFCGSVPQMHDVGDYFVTCPGCGIDGPAGDSDGLPHAADAWNTRADSKLAAAEARAEDADVLTDDMLRYAMAALGTNCPADADLYRAFWFHAITMRESQRKLAEGDAG